MTDNVKALAGKRAEQVQYVAARFIKDVRSRQMTREPVSPQVHEQISGTIRIQQRQDRIPVGMIAEPLVEHHHDLVSGAIYAVSKHWGRFLWGRVFRINVLMNAWKRILEIGFIWT